MKSNPKTISKNTSNSQIKFKSQIKQSQPELYKQPLRKISSSLKLNIKQIQNFQTIQNKLIQNQQSNSINKIKKNKRIQTQPTDFNNDNKNKKLIGWTQNDKLRYQLGIQKRLRQSLQRQNQTLKKQISFLNNFGTSMRTSINNKKNNNIQDNFSSNKDKILNRLNKKRDGVSGQSDNDSTGLYSAKNKSYQDNINQMYDQYAKKRIIPILENVYQVAKNYFTDFQQNYSKLLILFNQSKGIVKTQLYSKMQDLLFLFQVPILYKQKPKDLMRSVSKQRLQNLQKSKKGSRQASKDNSLNRIKINTDLNQQRQDLWPEYKSPTQLFQEFQILLSMIIKNNKLFSKFIKSQLFEKILRKIKQKK